MFLPVAQLRTQDLDRDAPVEGLIGAPVDKRDPALTDQVIDAVTAGYQTTLH